MPDLSVHSEDLAPRRRRRSLPVIAGSLVAAAGLVFGGVATASTCNAPAIHLCPPSPLQHPQNPLLSPPRLTHPGKGMPDPNPPSPPSAAGAPRVSNVSPKPSSIPSRPALPETAAHQTPKRDYKTHHGTKTRNTCAFRGSPQ